MPLLAIICMEGCCPCSTKPEIEKQIDAVVLFLLQSSTNTLSDSNYECCPPISEPLPYLSSIATH